MKKKKIIAMGIIYFFIFTLIPVGFLSERVQAVESFKKYDSNSTEIGNKYDVKENILKVKQYDDFTLAVTKDYLYFIEKGSVKKYDLSKVEILSETNIERRGKYIYLYPCKQNSSYKVLTIDSEGLTGKSQSIDEYIKLDNYINNPVLQEIAMDSKDNMWFSVSDKDKKVYRLLKWEKNSGNKINTVDKVEVNKDFDYDEMLTNLKIDSNENAWFKITENHEKTKKYMLGKISKDGKKNTFDLKENIIEYVIDKDESIWVIHKDKLVHLSKSGSLLKEFKGVNFKDLTKDSEGNLLVLDNNKIKKVYYSELKEIYTVSYDSKEISAQDKENIAVKNMTGITIINKGKMEKISADSYVKDSAKVLKEDNSDVKILSNRYNNETDEKENEKTFVEVNLKDGKFNIVNKAQSNLSNCFKSVIYDGDIYILSEDSVYKLKNNAIEKYMKLNVNIQMDDKLTSINVDKNGTIYAISEEKLFVIDKNKNVDEIQLSKLYSYNNITENKLIRDNKGDVYLITKTVGALRLNKLDGKEYRTINYRNKDGLEPINIFLNENNEFEFVYNDKEKPYKIYKLDENLLPQEDIRFNSEGSSLMQTYSEIQSLKKTADGKIILWTGKNMLYIKDKDTDKFRGLYDINSDDIINSMVKGNDGKVYIGTSNSGVLCYGEKISLDPSNYNTKIPKDQNEATENKQWTVKFNGVLDKTTVNEDNIFVVNSNGEKQAVKVALKDDKSSVTVTPEKLYNQEETYYIIVKEGLRSEKGKNIKKAILAKFKVSKKAEEEKKVEEEVKFEIIVPENIELREKSFVQFIIGDWKNENSLKVGKVTVEDLKVSTVTAYISFSAEIVGEKGKEIKKVSLNCKKIDGVWKII